MRGQMRAVIKPEAAPGALVTRVPIPEIGPQDVLVRVSATAICGTDIDIYDWNPWARSRVRPPMIFGHEFCGEVVEVGGTVKGIGPGDFVSAGMHVACGACYFCKTGRAHICRNVAILGVDDQGCFAEYARVPAANVWKVPQEIPVEVAAIFDPLGNAVHAAFSAEMAGSTIFVVGCGPIGLSAIAICKMCGAARIFAADVNPYRLGLAHRMGADVVLNPSNSDVASVVIAQTDGLGVDVVLEMSGHPAGIAQGLSALRKAGEICLLGLPAGPVEVDLANQVIFKEARIYGISGREMYATWYHATNLLMAGLDLKPLITHKFSLDDFKMAMDVARTGNCGKVVLLP